MLGVMVTAILGWTLYCIVARGTAFLDGFAGLLDRPVRGQRGLRAYLTGREFVGGEYEGRAVTLFVQHKRGDELGYLTVGLACASAGPAASDVLARLQAKEALYALVVRHDLTVELNGGWLRATWKPVGFFIFPGRFEQQRWREVLAYMRELVAEVEIGTSAATAPA